ncbi:MAG: hypothetical protein K0R54_5374 [Clostridiaceae bacterium]|jgi:hypothetical protein|nr:hypothetical protein [Clostridiaceae bacterium]MDF2948624.1 hypothetical protein [Sedimentibacter sp.]
MAKFEKTIVGNFEEVINRLQSEIINSGISMELVEESNYSSGDTNIAVRVYDKYFMRNGNRASLSLTVAGHGNDIFISAIGAGGGQGIIFNFSLGAEEELVDVVRFCVEQMN